mgnify:FL=1
MENIHGWHNLSHKEAHCLLEVRLLHEKQHQARQSQPKNWLRHSFISSHSPCQNNWTITLLPLQRSLQALYFSKIKAKSIICTWRKLAISTNSSTLEGLVSNFFVAECILLINVWKHISNRKLVVFQETIYLSIPNTRLSCLTKPITDTFSIWTSIKWVIFPRKNANSWRCYYYHVETKRMELEKSRSSIKIMRYFQSVHIKFSPY